MRYNFIIFPIRPYSTEDWACCFALCRSLWIVLRRISLTRNTLVVYDSVFPIRLRPRQDSREMGAFEQSISSPLPFPLVAYPDLTGPSWDQRNRDDVEPFPSGISSYRCPSPARMRRWVVALKLSSIRFYEMSGKFLC